MESGLGRRKGRSGYSLTKGIAVPSSLSLERRISVLTRSRPKDGSSNQTQPSVRSACLLAWQINQDIVKLIRHSQLKTMPLPTSLMVHCACSRRERERDTHTQYSLNRSFVSTINYWATITHFSYVCLICTPVFLGGHQASVSSGTM